MRSREDVWKISLNEDDTGDTGKQLEEVNKRRRRVFTAEEDEYLTKLVSSQKCTNWIEAAQLLPGRTPRQCRDRWINYLSPANTFAPWTPEEDLLIVELVNELDTKWMQIAKRMPGRSDNNIKNRWYSNVKKRCTILRNGSFRLKGSRARRLGKQSQVQTQPQISETENVSIDVCSPSGAMTTDIEKDNQLITSLISHEDNFWDRALANQLDDFAGNPFSSIADDYYPGMFF